jgi:DNA-binding CsgD family transcriptional regulator
MLLDFTNQNGQPSCVAIYQKNLDFKYSYVDDGYINVSKLHYDEIVGVSDDAHPMWAEYVSFRRETDIQAISGKTVMFIEETKTGDGARYLAFAQKKPLFDALGNIVGVDGKTKILGDETVMSLANLINSDSKMFGADKIDKYCVEQEYQGLSKRESECLFYLVRGKTIKEIGAILGLSPRTVETHINHIKEKLNCHSTSQLIDKAYTERFISILPRNLLRTLPIMLAVF